MKDHAKLLKKVFPVYVLEDVVTGDPTLVFVTPDGTFETLDDGDLGYGAVPELEVDSE